MDKRQSAIYSLGEFLAQVETGSRPSGGADIDSVGVPSLGGENLTLDGRLSTGSVRRIPLGFFNSMPSGHLRHMDVLMNKDGAQTGKVALYKSEFTTAAINEHLYLLRGDECLDQKYLYHFLRSRRTQHTISCVVSGSAQPGLNQDALTSIGIRVPVLVEQRRIADALDTIDSSILASEAVVAKYEVLRVGMARNLLSIDHPKSDLNSHDTSNRQWASASLSRIMTLEYGRALPKRNRSGSGFPVFGSNGVIGFHHTALTDGPGIVVGRKGTVGRVRWSQTNFWRLLT